MDRRDSITGQFVPSTAPNEERFWASVDKTPTCWNWVAGGTGAGYGVFYPNGSKQIGAHVWSWQQTNGPVPAGLVVDHRDDVCGNRRCVNPAHLRLLSLGGNVLASPKSNAGRNMRKTECDFGHPLSGPNLKVVPNVRNPSLPPWRQCRECANRRKRERRQALRGDNPQRRKVS